MPEYSSQRDNNDLPVVSGPWCGNPQVIEVHIVRGVALIGEVDVDEAGLFYWFGNHKLLMDT